MTIQVLDFLVSAIGILLVAGLWHAFWRPVAVAHLRQDFFDARDFLFDLVANNETSLTFDSHVYRVTREGLNSMIRFSHCISLFAAVIADFCIPSARTQCRERLAEFRENLTDEEKRVVGLVESRERRALLVFLLYTSPLLWAATMGVMVYLLALVGSRVLRGGLKALHGGVKACRRMLRDILFTPAIETVGYQLAMDILSNFGGRPGLR